MSIAQVFGHDTKEIFHKITEKQSEWLDLAIKHLESLESMAFTSNSMVSFPIRTFDYEIRDNIQLGKELSGTFVGPKNGSKNTNES